MSYTDPMGLAAESGGGSGDSGSSSCSCPGGGSKPGYWQNVRSNFAETNRAIPGLMLPTGVGLATAGTTARAIGSITFLQAAAYRGTPQFGGAMVFATVTAAVNTVLVGGAFEVGILAGSMLSAMPPVLAAKQCAL